MKIEKQKSKTQFEAKPFFGTLGILHTNSVWHGKLTKALQKWLTIPVKLGHRFRSKLGHFLFEEKRCKSNRFIFVFSFLVILL